MIACAPNGARRGTQDHSGHSTYAARARVSGCTHCLMQVFHCCICMCVMPMATTRSTRTSIALRSMQVQAEVGKRLVIQVTTEAVGIYSPEQQMAVVEELRPEAVSLALGRIVPRRGFRNPWRANFSGP